MKLFDVAIIGASASGLMCAIEATKRGRRVIVLDHAEKAAKKIRISGGGRCNFSNYNISAENYLSENKHFCKSALSRYQYYDFLALMAEYDIPWHEREHGQLFCDRSANDVVQMLLSECHQHGVSIQLNCQIRQVEKNQNSTFVLKTSIADYSIQSLVIASGGLSVSKMGASDFGLRIAGQFEINCVANYPGLVPLTYNSKDKKKYQSLSGIALPAEVSFAGQNFIENILFTHKGLSGPAILQISSYWVTQKKDISAPVSIKLLAEIDLFDYLLEQQRRHSGMMLKNILSQQLPKRLIEIFCHTQFIERPVKQYQREELKIISDLFQNWQFWPDGTEGYRVAEVTMGGVDTNELSSRTMQAKKISGLYFIGEVVDVTGQLGGYNFQWAWSSGFSAGQFV
ncbi:MAG: NAD(P)/FAD-dependent oxidoreductase [gamma proteobacterium symbiont of Taylorina sp.]|nr:NAD(P)/FAD-dependent oxidoreductase [gamma proteobacterium symbiont of Taylorina sp.]